MKIAALIAALLLSPLAAQAGEIKQFENGEAVTLQPDTAYILAREIVHEDERAFIYGILLVRPLSDAALQAAAARYKADPDTKEEPNTVVLSPFAFYADGDVEKVVLVAVPPETYVLAGETMALSYHIPVGTCMCMGTVQFDAKPGVITDLGYVLSARDDKPTTIPELAARVRGKDMDYDPPLHRMAVRPATPNFAAPPQLAGLPRVPADYRAHDRFPNFFGGTIDRLSPLTGVLDYDKDGRVLDLKGKAP